MPRPRPELLNVIRYPVPPAGRCDFLRLDLNENTEGPSRFVINTILAAVSPDFIAAYPETEPLYELLAKKHKVKTENVMITAGSEMAIRYVFEAYLDRGDEIVLLNPSFAMFQVHAVLCGAKMVLIDCDRRLQFDTQKIIDAISPKTKIVAIANPNNPTGTIVELTDLLEIIKTARRYDALVLIDEAYYYFYPKTMAAHLHRFDNVIVTRTLSKAGGMASVRLGYALGHRALIKEAMKLQPMDHANSFAVKFGEYFVQNESMAWDYARSVERGKKYLRAEAEKLGLYAPPGIGNFMLIDAGARKERLIKETFKNRILIKPNVAFPFPNTYVRVTVGPEYHMRRLVAVIKKVFR